MDFRCPIRSDGLIILTDGAIFRRDIQRSCPCCADRVSASVFCGPHAGNAADALVTRVAKDRALRVHLTKRTMDMRTVRTSLTPFAYPGLCFC